MKRYIFSLLILLSTPAYLLAQTKKNEPLSVVQKIPGTKLSFKMVLIPGGEFTIGSEGQGFSEPDEIPSKKIKISPFYMGAYEVTYDEFLLFMNDEGLSRNTLADAVTRPTTQYVDLSWGMGKQGGYPVNSMSQVTALMYCKWLYKKTGIFFRLPTEAEWEYAARAGSSDMYFFGNDTSRLGEYAWYQANSGDKYHKVGLKKPNPFGLYDIYGNVSEWTLDQYDEKYYEKLPNGAQDPKTEPGSRYPKSVRGGGYDNTAMDLRSANRMASSPEWNKRDPQIPKSKWWLTDAPSVGFRLVRPVKQPTKEEAEAFFNKFLK
jgi:formylglycine-generating enzyme required for sulfatase activity